MNNGGRYKTCILELVRNNGVLQERKSTAASFLTFDYFDILYYRELEGQRFCKIVSKKRPNEAYGGTGRKVACGLPGGVARNWRECLMHRT